MSYKNKKWRPSPSLKIQNTWICKYVSFQKIQKTCVKKHIKYSAWNNNVSDIVFPPKKCNYDIKIHKMASTASLNKSRIYRYANLISSIVYSIYKVSITAGHKWCLCFWRLQVSTSHLCKLNTGSQLAPNYLWCHKSCS